MKILKKKLNMEYQIKNMKNFTFLIILLIAPGCSNELESARIERHNNLFNNPLLVADKTPKGKLYRIDIGEDRIYWFDNSTNNINIATTYRENKRFKNKTILVDGIEYIEK